MISFAENARKRHRGYSGARPDIVSMICGIPRHVLDVGCGAGMVAIALNERYPGVRVVGIEPDAVRAQMAADHMSEVMICTVDDPAALERIEAAGPFDLILCADVLEHLSEPNPVLIRLAKMLTPSGALITSIPNVRHISTFVSLGLFGTWPARARGIHDRTHLRFFSRRDILALGISSGLYLVRERRNLRLIESMAWSMIPAKALDFWPFRAFLTFQYLHLWRRSPGSNV